MDKSLSFLLSVLHRRRLLSIILLLGTVAFLWTSSSTLIAFAQSGNLIGNPGFESGILDPWQKWGYLISDVLVRQCCGHTGAWSAYVAPNGRYVELQQNIPVTTRRTYELTAWVYTNGGLNAEVGWWTDAPGIGKTICARTNSTLYIQRYCQLNVPDNTMLFNVHLAGSEPVGNYAVTDDWSLTLAPSSGFESQAMARFWNDNIQAEGVRADVWTAQQPSGYNFINGHVAICTRIPCNSASGIVPGFVETGYIIGTVDDVRNRLQQYTSWNDENGTGSEKYGLGNLKDNTWYNFGVEYDTSQGKWFATRDGQRLLHPEGFPNVVLNFQAGPNINGCGPEGSRATAPLGMQCNNMQYKPVGQTWAAFDYNNVQIDGNYCVYKPNPTGAFGWGPCY